MTALGTVIHLALPPLSILALGRSAPRRCLAWTVAGLALYAAALLSVGLLLGYLGFLHTPVSLALWTLVAGLFFGLAATGAGPVWRTVRALFVAFHLTP